MMLKNRTVLPVKLILIVLISYYCGLTDVILPFIDERVFTFGGLIAVVFIDLSILAKDLSIARIKAFDCLYGFLFIGIICFCGIHTLVSGYANSSQVLSYAISCVLPILLLPLLYQIKDNGNAQYLWVDIFIGLVVASIILRMLNCLAFELAHTALFPKVLGVIRGGHITARIYALDAVLFFIELYRGFNYYRITKTLNKDAYLCLLTIAFITVFARGRMQILCVLISLIGFLLFQKFKSGDKALFVLVLSFLGIIFFLTPFAKDLMGTASSASSDVLAVNYDGTLLFQGQIDNTASVRLFTIKHGWEMMEKDPSGTGLVYYGTPRFKAFFPIGSNDDLGYIGTIFTFGYVSVLFIVPLILWGLIQSFRVRCQPMFQLRLSIVAYLVISGISLSLFDLSRIAALPFFICLLSAESNNLISGDVY